jgi:hypothetical protein
MCAAILFLAGASMAWFMVRNPEHFFRAARPPLSGRKLVVLKTLSGTIATCGMWLFFLTGLAGRAI